MFFYLRLLAFAIFSIKLIVLTNVLVLSVFQKKEVGFEIIFTFFSIKSCKKFVQTKIYYKFALA